MEIAQWLEQKALLFVPHSGNFTSSSTSFMVRGERKSDVISLLQESDIDVEDVVYRKKKRPSPIFTLKRDIFFTHKMIDSDKKVPFNFYEESQGTQKLYSMSVLINLAIRRGGILLVDEMSNSFHPLLAKHILDLFTTRKKIQRTPRLFLHPRQSFVG